jgi:hypothetical protein
MRISLSSIASLTKRIGVSCVIAATLTYLSLAVPGRAGAVCANLGRPIDCPVLAYGFPLPFIVDSQAVSPVGSVARDPMSLVAGEDELRWPQLGLSALFWMLVVVVGRLAWRRWRRRRSSGRAGGARTQPESEY